MRIYMRRRPGFRNIRGGNVIDLQLGLAGKVTTPLSIDGVFGTQTETALRVWQNSNGFDANGQVDELTWKAVTNKELPNLFRRSLAITAAFEGHGYTFAAGNWDNAYLTWGIVGFTLKHGNFGKVIEVINNRHPGLLESQIGSSKANELLTIINSSSKGRRAWGEKISLPPKKYRIRADWEDAFQNLGNRVEVRAIQDEVARNVYWKKAVSDLKRFGKLTEVDAALFFDISVQNGGINDEKAKLISNAFSKNPDTKKRKRLELIARAVADGSNPKYWNDVFSRKGSIASGEGTVHGATYFMEDWSIGLYDITDDNLLK